MKQCNGPLTSRMRMGAALAGLAMAAAVATSVAASAEEPDAKARFKAMADYVAAQKAISFNYDSNLEIVTTDMMKVGLASSGSLSLTRPDKIRMSRTGGLVDAEIAYDGKTLTVLGKNLNVFASAKMSGSIDELIDTMRVEYDAEAPAADLLSPNAYETMMANVTSAHDLGSGVIHGKVCDHVAFRTAETDWQLWIAQGDQPYPCRFEITSKMTTMAPSYTIDVTDWKTDADVAAAKYEIEPGNAKVVKIEELDGIDEVRSMLKEGMSQ